MTLHRHVIHALGGATMGTTWSVRLAAPANADLDALHAVIQARLDRVVAQMSTWDGDSDIVRYNRGEAGSRHPLADEFFTVLDCALHVAEASDGAFDPAVGPLVALWGFGADAASRDAPDAASRELAQGRVAWRRIELDRGRREVLQPGAVTLDLSAIAKGFGVDHVAAGLREAGIASALVEVGGELYGYGRKPDGDAWRVLVEAGPEEDDDALEPRVLALDGIAVASSGDRWHHYQREGRRYSHTIDPRSGEPVEHAPAAVTVIAADAMHADAWATALTVLGADAGLALAERLGLAARFLDRNGDAALRERMTHAFRARLDA